MTCPKFHALALLLNLGAFLVVGCGATPEKIDNKGADNRIGSEIGSENRADNVIQTPEAPPESSRPSRVTPSPAPAGWVTSSLVYPTGDARTGTILLTRSSPAEVLAGSRFKYSIAVKNISPVELSDVSVIELVPATLQIVESAPDPMGAAGPLGPAAGGLTEVRWALGSLARDEVKSIEISASSSETGSLATFLSVDYAVRLATVTHVIQPKLSLTMTTPAEVLLHDSVEIKPSLANNGVGPARQAKITYEVPEGFTVTSGTPSWTVPELGPGKTVELSALRLRAEKAGPSSHVVSGYATTNKEVVKAPPFTASIKVLKPELAISITGPEKPYVHRPTEFTLTVSNKGDGVSKNTVISLPVPNNANFASASHDGTLSGGVVKWNLGELEAGASKVVNVSFVCEAKEAALLEADGLGDAAELAKATYKIAPRGVPDLAVMLGKASPGFLVVNQDHTFEVKVKNTGTAMLTQVSLVCKLDDSIAYVPGSAVGPTNNPTFENGTLTFPPLASLSEGAMGTTSWRFKLRGVKPADVARIRIAVTCDEFSALASTKEEVVRVVE